MDERERGRRVAADRSASARGLLGRSGDASMILVLIPSPLHSYTKGRKETSMEAASLDELTHQLEAQFPGIRFRIVDEHDRIRKHIQFFVNGELERDLKSPVRSGSEVKIVCALSGG